MTVFNYAWHTPPRVNPEATHQFVRFFVTTDGVTEETGYSHMWEPLITKQLHTGQTFTLDVQEIAGSLKSAFSSPATGLVEDDPDSAPPPPPPPPGLPNTPATPTLAYREVALNQL